MKKPVLPLLILFVASTAVYAEGLPPSARRAIGSISLEKGEILKDIKASGEHYAAVVIRGETEFLVVDGKRAGPFKSVEKLILSKDGTHVACLVVVDGECRLLRDGSLLPQAFSGIAGMAFSEDGLALAANVSMKEKDDYVHYLLIDDALIGPYRELTEEIRYSASAQGFVYNAETMDKSCIIAHGKDRFDDLAFAKTDRPFLSPLSGIPLSVGVAKAVPEKTERGFFVYCGDKAFGPYADVRAVFWKPGSDDAFWLADRKGEGTRLYVNGATDETAEASQRQIEIANVCFSPDGRKLAYSCMIPGGLPGQFVFADKAYGPYAAVSGIQYGDDGKLCFISGSSLASIQVGDERFGPFDKASNLLAAVGGRPYGFIYKQDDAYRVRAGGREYGPYKGKKTVVYGLALSPSGQAAYCVGSEDGGGAVYVDGKKLAAVDQVRSALGFLATGELFYADTKKHADSSLFVGKKNLGLCLTAFDSRVSAVADGRAISFQAEVDGGSESRLYVEGAVYAGAFDPATGRAAIIDKGTVFSLF